LQQRDRSLEWRRALEPEVQGMDRREVVTIATSLFL
jgi:hypothetical protein